MKCYIHSVFRIIEFLTLSLKVVRKNRDESAFHTLKFSSYFFQFSKLNFAKTVTILTQRYSCPG